mmetsp:Transcript_21206/g.50198  ORF Transcript_21206/g.50198 Transcript_21206/m.50198 type:complete len:244 (-) Transcript_21206:32-763(-)
MCPGSPARETTADQAIRARTESSFFEALEIPGGKPVDVGKLDVAALVNASAPNTHFRINDDEKENFNATWRMKLREVFAAQNIVDELQEWESTGLSRGRCLKLQVMAIKPNSWFRVHGHPNIEFEHTLAGVLKEVRMKEPLQIDTFTPMGDGTLEGPDLGAMLAAKRQKEAAVDDDFYHGEVRKGEFLANSVGSVHQTYTEEEGALVLVLWSGCHANIRPEKCGGLADVLRPSAGWSCSCFEE